jgi:biopolymer transport protein ExbD
MKHRKEQNMNYLLEGCFITLIILANGAAQSAVAQVSAAVPQNSVMGQARVGEAHTMRKGISVDLPVTVSAVPVPRADSNDSVILTVAHSGAMYLGVNPISSIELAEKVKSALSNHTEKMLYIKADAHIPYATLITVLDLVHTAGVRRFTLLTAQSGMTAAGTLMPPEGLDMLVVSPHQ